MTRYIILMVLMAGMVFVAGCAAGQSTARTDYDFSKVSKVAVIDVLGPVGSEGAQNQLADMVTMQLLQKGYAPVERAQIQNILKEQQFQHDPNITPEQDAVKAGQILNIPTVVIVNISQFTEDISMTIKMLNVEDGSVLWIGSGSGTTGKTLGTILGAAGGAAIGVVVGGNDSSDKTAGGVIGGVVGGAAANLLAPQQAQAAEKIITRICKDMPARIPQEKKKLLNW